MNTGEAANLKSLIISTWKTSGHLAQASLAAIYNLPICFCCWQIGFGGQW